MSRWENKNYIFKQRKHKLIVPEKFILLGKSIATIESVCHLLNPQFKFVVVAKPFLKKYLPKLISSQFIFSKAKEEIFDYGELIVNMPKDVRKLVSIKEVVDTDDLMIINKSGITIRLAVDTLRVMGRATQGVRLIRLNDNDEISSVEKIEKIEGEDEEIDQENIANEENGPEGQGENPTTETEEKE